MRSKVSSDRWQSCAILTKSLYADKLRLELVRSLELKLSRWRERQETKGKPLRYKNDDDLLFDVSNQYLTLVQSKQCFVRQQASFFRLKEQQWTTKGNRLITTLCFVETIKLDIVVRGPWVLHD